MVLPLVHVHLQSLAVSDEGGSQKQTDSAVAGASLVSWLETILVMMRKDDHFSLMMMKKKKKKRKTVKAALTRN